MFVLYHVVYHEVVVRYDGLVEEKMRQMLIPVSTLRGREKYAATVKKKFLVVILFGYWYVATLSRAPHLSPLGRIRRPCSCFAVTS